MIFAGVFIISINYCNFASDLRNKVFNPFKNKQL